MTVNQENHRHIIMKFTACLRRRRFDSKKLWFQQDGATPHTAAETRKLLFEKFEDGSFPRKLPTSGLHTLLTLAHWTFFCGATQK